MPGVQEFRFGACFSASGKGWFGTKQDEPVCSNIKAFCGLAKGLVRRAAISLSWRFSAGPVNAIVTVQNDAKGDQKIFLSPRPTRP
jgi:hypothetical protein